MKILEISRMSTLIARNDLEFYLKSGTKGVHESMTRSFHIMEKVKDLLSLNTPPQVIAEIIEVMEKANG